MNYKHLFFLLIMPLCCLGEPTSTRDYVMVNYDTGLTSTMLDIGKTSFTFVVEWSPNTNTPWRLDLLSRLLPETRGWGGLLELELDFAKSVFKDEGWCFRYPIKFDPTQRKAVFEIPYRAVIWNVWDREREMFEQRAFFTVQWVVFSEEEWESKYSRGDHEIFGPNAYELGIVKSNDTKETITNHELGIYGL